MIVKYNYEKNQEIKKFQSNQNTYNQNVPASLNEDKDAVQAMSNYSLSNQRYLHDMKREQEALQDKIDFADKIL